MDSRQSIDVLDLASARPTHRRTHSSKSSILKALISPVKTQRKTEHSTSHKSTRDSYALKSRHENVSSEIGSRHVRDRDTELASQMFIGLSSKSSKTTTDSPSKKLKENVDPFTSERKQFSDSDPAKSRSTPTLARSTGKVMAVVAALQKKSTVPVKDDQEVVMDPRAIDAEFEAMLEARNVLPHMREKMRGLTLRVKADLVKQEQLPIHSPSKERLSHDTDVIVKGEEIADGSRSTKRSRPRSRTFTFSRGDRHGDDSPSKKRRSRSKSRAEAEGDVSNRSPSKTRAPSRTAPTRNETPVTYIAYLKTHRDPTQVEVGRLHKLRILLRNETVSWVEEFVALHGMSLINTLLNDIMEIEWREEHEDQLLHETLLCLKGLCTTASAIVELEKHAESLLPSLIAMLFDAEKKGPSEYSTRMVIINILFSYLACKLEEGPQDLEARARSILRYLSQAKQSDDVQPLEFVQDMHTPRPYQAWAKEMSNVTREVFWIFLHQLNIIPDRPSSSNSRAAQASSFAARHFPGARAPVPAAPYIGGVEWDAAMYLTAHLDLLNGLVAALPSQQSRSNLRQEMQLSGFEKTMGGTLRTCKEKFYAGIHDGLRAWVRAASEDGWPTALVCEGYSLEERAKSARTSPQKPGKKQAPPKLEEIKLDCTALDLELHEVPVLMNYDTTNDDDWLG